jgi:capsular polysaccharide biosynthesis protein
LQYSLSESLSLSLMEEIKYIIKESDSDTVSFRSVGQLLKKRMGMFSATVAVVVFAVFFFTIKTKPFYDTKIPIGSSYFTGNSIEPMIIYLSDLRNDGNYKMLAEKLGISEEEARAIARIQVRNKSTQNNFYTADISLRVYQPEAIPKISEGIMNFFEQNDFVKNRVEVMKKELEDFTSNGERELMRLDSVKQALRKVLEKHGSISNNIIFPSNIHLEAVMINEKVYQARQNLKLIKGVELLAQPAVPASPSNPSKFLLLFTGLLVGIVLGVFVVIGVENLS